MQSFDDNEMEIVTEDEVETPLGGDLNNPEKKAMKLYVFFLFISNFGYCFVYSTIANVQVYTNFGSIVQL